MGQGRRGRQKTSETVSSGVSSSCCGGHSVRAATREANREASTNLLRVGSLLRVLIVTNADEARETERDTLLGVDLREDRGLVSARR